SGLGWLPSLLAHLRPFNAMIDAVAHQMRQGIPNRFQDGFIKLHLVALDEQRDLLPQFLRKITHHALKLMEDIAQRLQARRRNGFLQFRGHEIDTLGRGLDGWRIARRDGAQQLVPRQHQLTGERHETIEKLDMHAQGIFSHYTWHRFGRCMRGWGHVSDVWRQRRSRGALRSRCTLWGSGCKTLDTTCIECEETTDHVRIKERGKQDVER